MQKKFFELPESEQNHLIHLSDIIYESILEQVHKEEYAPSVLYMVLTMMLGKHLSLIEDKYEQNRLNELTKHCVSFNKDLRKGLIIQNE